MDGRLGVHVAADGVADEAVGCVGLRYIYLKVPTHFRLHTTVNALFTDIECLEAQRRLPCAWLYLVWVREVHRLTQGQVARDVDRQARPAELLLHFCILHLFIIFFGLYTFQKSIFV